MTLSAEVTRHHTAWIQGADSRLDVVRYGRRRSALVCFGDQLPSGCNKRAAGVGDDSRNRRRSALARAAWNRPRRRGRRRRPQLRCADLLETCRSSYRLRGRYAICAGTGTVALSRRNGRPPTVS